MRSLQQKHGNSDWRLVITITVASVFLAVIFHWQPSGIGSSFLQREGAMLQLVAGKQVLNFGESAVFIASEHQLLTIRFADASAVMPQAIEHDQDAGQLMHALGQVRYAQLWRGVDLVYEQTSDSVIEATWYIAPSAAPEQIQLEYGVVVNVDQHGLLVVKAANGRASQHRAVAWQQIDGHRKAVEVGYQIKQAHADSIRLGFKIGHYDSAQPLYIDPDFK